MEGAAERFDLGQFLGDAMRRLIVLRGDLERVLACRGGRIGQAGEERSVVLHPVERRVREDQIEGAAVAGKRLDRPDIKGETWRRVLAALFEHSARSVDAHRLSRVKPLV